MDYDRGEDELIRAIERRALFHLLALHGGQVKITAAEYDALAGMKVALRVNDDSFIFTLVSAERGLELEGPSADC